MNEDESKSVPWLAASFVVVLMGVLVAIAWFVSRQPWETAYRARTEEGIFEQLTNVFYGAAFVLCIAVAIGRRWRRGFHGAVVILALGLRELDFHTRFTRHNINSTRYWLSKNVPLLQKLLVALLLVGVFYALVMFLRGRWPKIREALRRRRAWTITVAGIFVFLAVSQMVDHFLETRIIDSPAQIAAVERMNMFFSLIEESFELGVPILICVALVQGARSCGDELITNH